MRTIKVPVYLALMKGTESQEDPIVTVTGAPYTSGVGFESYHWYRTELSLPIQESVTEIDPEPVEAVPEKN